MGNSFGVHHATFVLKAAVYCPVQHGASPLLEQEWWQCWAVLSVPLSIQTFHTYEGHVKRPAARGWDAFCSDSLIVVSQEVIMLVVCDHCGYSSASQFLAKMPSDDGSITKQASR